MGEDALAQFLGDNPNFSVFATALVGLIPNCAASVVIAQLYVEGVLGAGAMLAGLLVSAGVGLLVLARPTAPGSRMSPSLSCCMPRACSGASFATGWASCSSDPG